MAEVIVALDFPTAGQALAMVTKLPGLRWAKIGATLAVPSGLHLVDELKRRGIRVFLDLKWHDIPHQVAGAVASAAAMGVDLATGHALGGRDMLVAAAAARGEMQLVAVTVLTSHTPGSFGEVTGRPGDLDLAAEAARLTRLAAEAGLDGVVTSPAEIGVVREAFPGDPLVVVPGIRLPGDPADDQRRTATPAAAVAAGATHLVVGRSVTRATDPSRVYQVLCGDT